MSKLSSLAERMKGYESVTKDFLMKRTPVIIRLDGAHFKNFTRTLEKPFDSVLTRAMEGTLLYLCKNIQGCVFGYSQSDEISLLLCDFQTLTTDGWFGYNIQKMVSTAAAMATLSFNHNFESATEEFSRKTLSRGIFSGDHTFIGQYITDKMRGYKDALKKCPTFDARVFNLPKEEVNNYFVWRQADGERNAISALAQKNFSQKELNGVSTEQLKIKLKEEKNIDWTVIPYVNRMGFICIKDFKYNNTSSRPAWGIDTTIPYFKENQAIIKEAMDFE